MRSPLRGLMAAAVLSVATVGAVNGAAAQDKIRIGLIYTLTGPAAVLGQQSKNGFELALKDLGGKIGGKEVELFVVDDELKPDVAIQKVKELLDKDKVDIVVGPIFSNMLQAIHKPVMDSGKILISTNAGASSFAGAACNANFFVTSYQNDQVYETLGEIANKKGYKKVFAMVPNYQAGKDALAGFKSTYKGTIVEEALVPLNSMDRQAELTKLASLKPDALFAFMPGGLGITMIKQFNQAGLKGKIPIISAFTADEATLARARRRRRRRVRRAHLGAGHRQCAEQEIRRRLRGRLQGGAGVLCDAGLRHRHVDRQRGPRRSRAMCRTPRR